jgi:S1-C subfamily serine protease
MLPPEAAERLGLPASARAVVVVKVARRGIAAGVLAVGDIIAEMDKKPIRSLSDFADAEKKANFDEGVLMLVQRRNRRFYVVVK